MRSLKKLLLDSSEYYPDNLNRIRAHNNTVLRDGSFLYGCILLIYTILSFIDDKGSLVSWMYYIYDIIHIILTIAIFTRSEKSKSNSKITNIYVFFFELNLLSFFALEGALFSQVEHSLYIPIPILLVAIFFIHKLIYYNIMVFIYTFSYALISILTKEQSAWINDLYIAIGTFFSSTIAYVLVSNLRYNEGKAIKKYEFLSKMDLLTGLYNKSTIESYCHDILSVEGKPLAFLIIDIDNFKYINDNYGHEFGDEVIRKMAIKLKEIFDFDNYIGRFGGDEFILLITTDVELTLIIEKIKKLEELVENLDLSHQEMKIKFSTGITFRKDDDIMQTMFRRADLALYEAKEKGKGQIIIK